MSQSELWSVAVAPDNIQTMTLDQLDDAFQKGLITENALVWTEGMEGWERLEDVLGGDEPSADEAPEAPAAVGGVVAVAASAPAAAPLPTASVQAPLGVQAPLPAQALPPQGSIPPQGSFAPQASIPPQGSFAPQSTAPVALNLGDDLGLDDFARPKKSKWGYLAAAAVVLGGVGFTVANATSKAPINPTQAAAAALPVAPSPGDEPLNLPSASDPNAPLAGGGGYKISAAEEAKMKAEAEKEEEQRAKIAAALANKPPEPAAAKPKRKGGGGGKQRAAKPQSSPIKKGGSKFDPLNGSLD